MATNNPDRATGRQPGHPNLQGPRWKAGESGNPAGVSKYMTQLRRAIEEQETPERVCEVVAAMHTDATAHQKYSPAAAKVYLGAVGLQLDGQPVKVDLSDAPDEVVAYLAEKLH